MPFFPRGSKKEIRDDKGNLLFNARNSRIVVGGNYTKEQAENIVNQLIESGYKKVQKNKLSIDLPSKCPSCKRQGNPGIVADGRFELKLKQFRLHYNHSSSPKTCHVGTVDFKNGMMIKLKKGLPIDSLGYMRRVGEYPLK